MAQVTLPYTLTAGTAENVNNLNSNLNALATGVNTIDTAQLTASATKPVTYATLGLDTLDVLTPIGSLVDYAGAGDPTPGSGSIKWLLADGRAVSRTTYAALYAVTSTAYGVGDGVTTFNLPDFRGRMATGPDSMGTAQGAASRTTTNNTVRPTAGSGGTEFFTLASANIPAVTSASTTPTMTFTGTAGTTGNDADVSGGVGVRQWMAADGFSYYFSYGYSTNPGGSNVQVNAYKTHTHSFTPAGTISGGGHTHTLGNASPTAIDNRGPFQVANKIIRVA